MRRKKVAIYIKLEDIAEPIKLETCKDRETAEAKIRRYERQDRYEVEVEGYGFPHGIPKYIIKPA